MLRFEIRDDIHLSEEMWSLCSLLPLFLCHARDVRARVCLLCASGVYRQSGLIFQCAFASNF